MTGRYIRKAVPLEVRGVSRGSHPLPEKADDHTGRLFSHIPANRHVCVSSEESGPPSPSRRSEDSFFSPSHGWLSGNTTDRSSIYSLGDDEYDRAAAERVWRMFEEIDGILFEKRGGPQSLIRECDEWLARFPHLRILGKQEMAPRDSGYEVLMLSTSAQTLLVDVNDHDISALAGQLSVLGQQLNTHHPQLDTTDLQEEVFAEDGFVEDVIAIDYKSPDDDLRSTQTRRHYTGMPPITPHACVRDNINAAIFDFIWAETISWLRNLLTSYAKLVITDDDGEDEDDTLAMLHLCEEACFSPPRHIFPSSRETSLLCTGRLPKKVIEGRLEDLLTISTKALQSREKSSLGESLELSLALRPASRAAPRLLEQSRFTDRLLEQSRLTDRLPERPLDSGRPLERAADFARPASVRYAEHGRLSSARTRTTAATRGRLLAPLAVERARTPNAEEEKHQRLQNEVLRGHRLHTITDPVAAPPTPAQPFSRNGTLPPISVYDLPEMTTALVKTRSKLPFGRIGSAFHDKESMLPYKERERSFGPLEARPSTTHNLYRTDTPFGRRSSTPMGLNNNIKAAQGGAARCLNVTGSGISPQADAAPAASADVSISQHLGEFTPTTAHWGGASGQVRRGRSQQNCHMPVS